MFTRHHISLRLKNIVIKRHKTIYTSFSNDYLKKISSIVYTKMNILSYNIYYLFIVYIIVFNPFKNSCRYNNQMI